MERIKIHVAEAATPARDGNERPKMDLVFDPETGEFYTVPEDQIDPTKYGIVTDHVEY